MDSLQTIIYKTLPPYIKAEIINNPDDYPEYAEVVTRLYNEILKEKTSKIKSKVKLTKNKVALIHILSIMYFHIINNPPKDTTLSDVINAWINFAEENFPSYTEIMVPNEGEDVHLWPKYMFLIYYTYIISYQKWYNLSLEPQVGPYALSFNRNNDKLIDYIYKTYHHLDEKITLNTFRHFGY